MIHNPKGQSSTHGTVGHSPLIHKPIGQRTSLHESVAGTQTPSIQFSVPKHVTKSHEGGINLSSSGHSPLTQSPIWQTTSMHGSGGQAPSTQSPKSHVRSKHGSGGHAPSTH